MQLCFEFIPFCIIQNAGFSLQQCFSETHMEGEKKEKGAKKAPNEKKTKQPTTVEKIHEDPRPLQD